MIKYVEKSIVFEEIPDRVTLAFSISNCQNRCKGCHSAHLRCDIGEVLDENVIENTIKNSLFYCIFIIKKRRRENPLL